MNFRFGCIIILVLAFAPDLTAQSDAPVPGIHYPGGISLGYGIGSYGLRDEYISPERYMGILPYYAIGWTRSHQKYIYKLDLTFRQSDGFKNNNVTSDVLAFKLGQGFLYPVTPLNLFRKKMGLWLGPTTDVAYLENNPDIAVSGFDYTNSFATLISLGFRGDVIYPISGKVAVVSNLQLTVLSIGMRAVDAEEDDQAGTKLLTPVSGWNTSFDLGIGYDPLKWLSLGIHYRFDLVRITAWEDLLFAGNSAIMTLHINF
jgi:hypothetical protein